MSINTKKPTFYGYLEGWLSIIVNILLFILKYWAGVVTGSVALVVGAWHSLSDSLTSIVVIIGVKVSSKPADKQHPFGHGRAELVGSIIIGTLLFYVASNFMVESISKIKSHELVEFGLFAKVAVITSIICKEILAQYAIWAGKKIKSNALIADGWHHRSDSITSIIILVGIFIGKYFWWMDGALGIIVSLVLFYATFKIMKSTISAIIGEKLDEDIIIKIHELAKNTYTRDIKIHHIHYHTYGRHSELTFCIMLPPKMRLKNAHDIANKLEKLIQNECGMESTIHLEPLE